MKALAKTLYGDIYNLSAVAVILAVGAGLTLIGQPKLAWLAMPALTLAAVGWLARR